MQNYGFGALHHPEALMPSIENQDDDLAYLPYHYAGELEKFDGLGLQLTDELNLDSSQWPYLDGSADLLDSQFMSQIPMDNSAQLIFSQQQLCQEPSQNLPATPCPPSLAQRRAIHAQQTLQQPSVNMPLQFACNMSTAAPSVSSTTTPPHIGPLDYVSPWPTPELEPASFEDLNGWMSLDHSHRRSPGSISSSIASSVATPSYHSRASSLDSVPRFKPSPAQKEKPQCWDHGCNGRSFSTYGNYVRHCRERSDKRPQRKCPRCGALFSRTTARNQHLAKNACNRIRRYSNGRQRPDLATKMTE